MLTGSRADYGLFYWLIKEMTQSKKIDLKIIVSGMHLLKDFGNTIKEIRKDGFKVNSIVNIKLKIDTDFGIAKSIGLGVKNFTSVFQRIRPDLLVLMGDRFETFAAATSANILRLPIAHIHGGETTLGAFDEAFRHSITKMSHLHFTSTRTYRKRVIQLGEHPRRVFYVGAPGLENIIRFKMLSKKEISQKLFYKFAKKNFMITYHPVTLENNTSEKHFKNILKAINKLKNTHFIFTKANADTGGRIINTLIDKYVKNNPEKAWKYESLGQLKYLSVLKFMDGVVGNSSSGIIEAPSLGIATINIGDRQSWERKS